MKIKNLKLEDDYQPTINDLENIFNIYEDKNNNMFFNLNSTLYIGFNSNDLEYYICKTDMQWPLVSYKLYGTTHLAWLLMKINNVRMEDSFKPLHAGQYVWYLSTDDVREYIVSELLS